MLRTSWDHSFRVDLKHASRRASPLSLLSSFCIGSSLLLLSFFVFTMFVLIFVCLISSGMAAVRVHSVCVNGHRRVYLRSLKRYSISKRNLCYYCGQGRARMRAGGRLGGLASTRAGEYGAGVLSHASRDVGYLFTDYQEMSAARVCFVEVWASAGSRITHAAAVRGCYAVRVCRGEGSGTDVTGLVAGRAHTAYCDLETALGRRALEGMIVALLALPGLRRVVLITSPECKMHCPYQKVTQARLVNYARAGRISRSRLRVLQQAFVLRRRVARSAVVYARFLHSFVDRQCAGIDVVHVHEQPTRSRMSALNTAADDFTRDVWPSALGDAPSVDVAACRVGYGDLDNGRRIGKSWRFQVCGSDALLYGLGEMQCRCSTLHEASDKQGLVSSARYSYKLGTLVVSGCLCR